MRACVRACRISGLSSILRYSLLGCRSPLSFFPSLFLSQKACYISLSLSPLGLCLFLCDSFMKLDPMMALLLLPVTFFLRPFPLFFNFFLSFYTVAAVVVSVTETKNAPLMFVLTFEPEGPWSWPSRFPKRERERQRERERERERGWRAIDLPTDCTTCFLSWSHACMQQQQLLLLGSSDQRISSVIRFNFVMMRAGRRENTVYCSTLARSCLYNKRLDTEKKERDTTAVVI